MDSITIRRPDDWHLHLREGEMMQKVLPFSASQFGRALIMPNTIKPILTADDAVAYRKAIWSQGWVFEPLMTIKLTPATTPAMIARAKAIGVVAGKLYPEGVTTNSADGVSDFKAMWPVFEAMQTAGMVLCLHGEMPGVFVLDRERAFLEILREIVIDFGHLSIVLEHVSTAEAVDCVMDMPDNVAATITVHHLLLTLDDVIGDMLEPHHFCKPVAKTPEDRVRLLGAATSGFSKFFLGTDSAPHIRASKENASGCAGVFSAPVALALLAEIFESAGWLHGLQPFVSENGARFYGLPLNEGQITLVRRPWLVPADYEGIVPLRAGQRLEWQVLA